MARRYRLAQRFVRIEAIGTPDARSGEPEDPLQLQVAITPSADMRQVIQSATAGVSPRERFWRAGRGYWVCELDPRLYEPGKSYTAHYRFAMTPNNTKVVRQSFVWQAPVETPIDPDHLIVYGEMVDGMGLPLSGGRIVVEQYDDVVALTKRKTAVDVTADAFGNWYIEVPRNAILRFVSGADIDIRKTPGDRSQVSFDELPVFQPDTIVRKDRYGYPFPT